MKIADSQIKVVAHISLRNRIGTASPHHCAVITGAAQRRRGVNAAMHTAGSQHAYGDGGGSGDGFLRHFDKVEPQTFHAPSFRQSRAVSGVTAENKRCYEWVDH